ncbi:MAG: hypothetical protein ABR597_04260 [Bacteroidales bacterium]
MKENSIEGDRTTETGDRRRKTEVVAGLFPLLRGSGGCKSWNRRSEELSFALVRDL